MSKSSPNNARLYGLIGSLLLIAGFVFSFWPLGLLGLLLAAAVGQYGFAIVIGLLMDIGYGAPIGQWHFLYVPFTLLSFILCVLHYLLSAYFREGGIERL